MKIVNIIGGLGNQMFQFAFALALKQRWPDEEVLIDISHFNHIFFKSIGAANLHNGFEINRVFPNANLPVAKAAQLKKVTRYIPNYILSRIARKYLPPKKTEIVQNVNDYFAYDPSVFYNNGDLYFEGIWESISYHLPLRDKIQNIFKHNIPSPLNAVYIQDMESQNSVGIHVRRGDYLKHPGFRGICDIDYYRRGIKVLLEDSLDHVFYIFSNDIPWCEEHLKPLLGNHECVFVTTNVGEDSCWDMFLMSHCKDLIIANSSFSWWGAFLNNRGGRVIAPAKWVNRDADFDIWAPECIRL